MMYRDQIYSPFWNSQKIDNIHDATLSKILYIRQQKGSIRDGNKSNEHYNLDSVYGGSFLLLMQRAGAQLEPSGPEGQSWASGDTKGARALGQRVLEKNVPCREWTTDICRVSFENLQWPLHSCEETTTSQGKNHPKGQEVTVPNVHPGPERVPVAPARPKNLKIYGAMSKVKYLPHNSLGNGE